MGALGCFIGSSLTNPERKQAPAPQKFPRHQTRALRRPDLSLRIESVYSQTTKKILYCTCALCCAKRALDAAGLSTPALWLAESSRLTNRRLQMHFLYNKSIRIVLTSRDSTAQKGFHEHVVSVADLAWPRSISCLRSRVKI
jgi:hypothetical protein